MSASRRVTLVAVAAAVILAAAIAVAVWPQYFSFGAVRGATSRGATSFTDGSWHRTDHFRATGPVRALVVSSRAGTVSVTGTYGSAVTATERISYRGAPPQMDNAAGGHGVILGYRCQDCSVDYAIAVPRGLTVTASQSAGPVNLSSLDGRIVAQDSVGMISATGLSGSAVLIVSAGQISAAFDRAPRLVKATAATGSIMLRVPAPGPYAVTASAPAGSASIRVPRAPSAPNVISARADHGSILVATD